MCVKHFYNIFPFKSSFTRYELIIFSQNIFLSAYYIGVKSQMHFRIRIIVNNNSLIINCSLNYAFRCVTQAFVLIYDFINAGQGDIFKR